MFKVGDRVMCLSIPHGSLLLVVGKKYTVKCIVQEEYLELEEISKIHNYSYERFELCRTFKGNS